ncbi:hypothetical protein CUMW_228100 [Citrus unshiu]|uniref:Uncharacterized protein n=1 Tax=Citrus unshiu TaxID=55188 RepID=A0A2H5QHP0_CITUN|nr:hypothetical protein CUMW_228100 [Citrus unshiu]
MSLVDKITRQQYMLHIPNRKYLTSAEGKEPMREKKAKKGIRELPPQLSLQWSKNQQDHWLEERPRVETKEQEGGYWFFCLPCLSTSPSRDHNYSL